MAKWSSRGVCIHGPSLWLTLSGYRIPDSMVNISQSLYKDGKSCIKQNGMTGYWFDVVTCSILSPLLSAMVMDWIMKKSLRNSEGGLEWIDGSSLCDLDYANDIAPIKIS